MINTMVWKERLFYTQLETRKSSIWTSEPNDEIRYVVADITEAHHKYNSYTAEVGIIVTDENGNAVSNRRMWASIDFIIDSNLSPSNVTRTLDSAFRACAADFASRVMLHKQVRI